MEKQIVTTEKAPAAIGPYSQAVKAGNLLFCSGQIALDPETGEMTGTGIKEQASRALENLRAVLEAGGSTMEKVVKTTVYLADLSDFQEMGEIYAEFFQDTPPARAACGVSSLPKGALIMIEAIAITG